MGISLTMTRLREVYNIVFSEDITLGEAVTKAKAEAYKGGDHGRRGSDLHLLWRSCYEVEVVGIKKASDPIGGGARRIKQLPARSEARLKAKILSFVSINLREIEPLALLHESYSPQ